MGVATVGVVALQAQCATVSLKRPGSADYLLEHVFIRTVKRQDRIVDNVAGNAATGTAHTKLQDTVFNACATLIRVVAGERQHPLSQLGQTTWPIDVICPIVRNTSLGITFGGPLTGKIDTEIEIFEGFGEDVFRFVGVIAGQFVRAHSVLRLYCERVIFSDFISDSIGFLVLRSRLGKLGLR